MSLDFRRTFKELTDHEPLRWQERLFRDHFLENKLRSVIDLPTGLGKTMVMAIWLIARSVSSKLPRRLIYVVDRRTVVDQATDLAVRLNQKAAQTLPAVTEKLAISTLRGQLADNREWTRDPSRLAIIIGTVDLIGSALLFSGYRSSYKRRPLEAGFLGQDSLLVLDEAHLSKPFEKLICAISSDGTFQKGLGGTAQGSPMRVIRMSATSSSAPSDSFTLQVDANGNLTGEDANDGTTTERFVAKKRLTITTLGEKEDLNKALADATIELAQKLELIGKRIAVFVRSPDDARNIAERIRCHARPSKSKSNPDPKGPYASSVEVLTGTMRGLERDELVEKDVFKQRWLNGDLMPDDAGNRQPVFLVSTSAGEVGFDLNADHLVGDAAPIDSWIQRLGRVNRRGTGDATVILIKAKKPADKTDFDKACIAASNLLTDGMDVSPRALAAFKKSLSCEQIDQASSPKPAMVELTDILLDGWSMTSIIEPMPARPEVGPWLRGIADDLPQTSIAWRAELDEPGFADLDLEDIEEWFDAHRILTHETLSVPTSIAAKWLTDRWDELKALQSQVADRPVIIDQAGTKVIAVKPLIDQLSRKASDSASVIRYAELTLPASFGGIERGVGLLDAAAPKPEEDKNADEGARTGNARQRLAAPDVADVARGRPRLREVITTTEDGEPAKDIIGNGTMPPKPVPFRLNLVSDEDRTVRLVSYVPRRERPEYGSGKAESLASHVKKVQDAMDGILNRLEMPTEINQAARLAADFHDHGKMRERWQWCAGRKADDEPLGKSRGPMKRDSRGYRHEFGSLREFTDANNSVSPTVFDLVMHLIATHHGRGRPHFPKGAFDPDCEARSDEIHAEAIRRFARLQRKYGWWHLAWLENLLRCADATASAQGSDEQENEPESGE